MCVLLLESFHFPVVPVFILYVSTDESVGNRNVEQKAAAHSSCVNNQFITSANAGAVPEEKTVYWSFYIPTSPSRDRKLGGERKVTINISRDSFL